MLFTNKNLIITGGTSSLNNHDEESLFLSRKTCLALKGILACMVLICHLQAKVTLFNTSILGTMFSSFGYLSVAGFLFLSGFGLNESYGANGNIKSMVRKRIVPFYILCVFVIAVYVIRDLIFYKSFFVNNIVQSLLWGGTVVDKGWYLQEQMLLYLLFFIAWRCIKDSVYRLLVLTGLIALHIGLCVFLQYDSIWYEGAPAFLLGIFVSYFKGSFISIMKKNQKAVMLLVVLIPVFLVTLYYGNAGILPSLLRIALKMVSCILFCLLMTTLSSMINCHNKATSFLGKICFEIYVFQGIFLKLFFDTWPIVNEICYLFIVVFSTILFSFALSPIISILQNEVRKLVKVKNNS